MSESERTTLRDAQEDLADARKSLAQIILDKERSSVKLMEALLKIAEAEKLLTDYIEGY